MELLEEANLIYLQGLRVESSGREAKPYLWDRVQGWLSNLCGWAKFHWKEKSFFWRRPYPFLEVDLPTGKPYICEKGLIRKDKGCICEARMISLGVVCSWKRKGWILHGMRLILLVAEPCYFVISFVVGFSKSACGKGCFYFHYSNYNRSDLIKGQLFVCGISLLLCSLFMVFLLGILL